MTDILDPSNPSDNVDKRLLDKDAHIAQVESEAAALREELRNRVAMEDLLAKLEAQHVEPLVRQPEPRQNQEPTPPQNTDISEKVRSILAEENAKAKREANVSSSRAGLIERFGDKYNETLKSIAKVLQVSEGFLSDLAATNPNGFFKVIDSVKPIADDTDPGAPPASTVDTSKAFGQQVRKNDAYFKKLYHDDPVKYFSVKVQTEMHNEAIRQGPKFYEP